MNQDNKKISHFILGFKISSILAAVLSLTALILPVFTEEAKAGELYRSQQTLRKQTGLGQRRIAKSTKAAKSLSQARSSKTLDFNQSSPYEARMVTYNTAMRKYDRDVAKWEYKTDQLQAKIDKRHEKERLRQQATRKKEREKLAKIHAREQEREERRNRQATKNSPTSFLARAFGGKDAAKEENKTVISDEKAKKAEAFFGSVESDSTTIATSETPAKPKLSFWQRLSRALFGGK